MITVDKTKIQTLKGFRDFLPAEARKRQYVISTLKRVFESYGFEPLETPALEYEEVLAGKYGDEGNKLMYRFTDNGGRRVALRYDQTVPLARVVAQLGAQLPMPFKRYQIQPVWRAENPQKGRYREFVQCDIDTVGTSSLLADAEIVACAIASARKLGFKNLVMNVNDRAIFPWIETKYMTIIDKLPKIGRETVESELIRGGMKPTEAKDVIQDLLNEKPTKSIQLIFSYLKEIGFKENKDFLFNPLIVRGLDYYTSIIFELVDPQNPSFSLGGGGRYDNLIGTFSSQKIPATGFAFGFDRLIETMDEWKLFPESTQFPASQVLVTIFNKDLTLQSIKVTTALRSAEVNAELYSNEAEKLDKQLKYANTCGIPWVVILGPEEAKNNKVLLKNMTTGKQEILTVDEVVEKLTAHIAKQ